jgi:hypothetical protein
MMNLSKPEDRKALFLKIKEDIDNYCADKYSEGHRNHLGASVMGESCARKLWYIFRWVKKEKFSGRMQRLFQVGHNAEPRFAEYLTGIGFTVNLFDIETTKQYRISAHNEHFGGSLDGIATNLETNERFLVEFKTNGTGAGYSDVGKLGVAKAKPKHFAQMSIYGFKYQLKYAIYMIENKNDSDITVEVVPLDWQLGEQLIAKAGDIINDDFPPTRIAENPSFFECKYCNFVDICHHGECVEINCRSCRFAKPIEAGEWYCRKHNGQIPKEFVKQGCQDHMSCNIE